MKGLKKVLGSLAYSSLIVNISYLICWVVYYNRYTTPELRRGNFDSFYPFEIPISPAIVFYQALLCLTSIVILGIFFSDRLNNKVLIIFQTLVLAWYALQLM